MDELAPEWTGLRDEMTIDPTQLQPIAGSALLYPCCGEDLGTPMRLFASAVSAFHFADIRRPRRPTGSDAELLRVLQRRPVAHDQFRDRASGNEFDLYRWEQRGEDVFTEVHPLGVFFHRGDTLANGEGSSGVPWLGREWLTKILGKLVHGGFLVTDGSNRSEDGPPQLSDFHANREIGVRAVRMTRAFEFAGRSLSCVGYAGDRYGPTLIWQAA